MSEGDAVPGCQADGTVGSGSTPDGRSPGPRAAKPGSVASSAKRSLNGHTSCVVCRLTRFEIPLMTGRRPLREQGT